MLLAGPGYTGCCSTCRPTPPVFPKVTVSQFFPTERFTEPIAGARRKLDTEGHSPPSGTHRHYFKVYAPDTKLYVGSGLTVDQVRQAMQGHVTAKGQLMGRYTKK